MGQPFIVIGDQTDHGGQVVEGSPTTTTGGKSIARVGDKVTCAEHGHGPTTIVTGDETMLIDSKPAARHGDKCACGATLIATQFVSTAGGSGGATSSAGGTGAPSSSGSAGSSSTASAVAAAPIAATASAAQAAFTYDEQVQLLCPQGQDLPVGMPYCIVPPTGDLIFGRVDASGLLPRVTTSQASEYHVLWGDEALEMMQ
jgi:uncharacterized Zn-binding protein involved in type VI secretion